MKRKILAAIAAAALSAASANALTINLISTDAGSAAGTLASKDFRIAANYWQSQFTNNVTVNINIGFSSLAPNVLASTGSSYWVGSVGAVKTAITNNAQTTLAIQAAAHLPTLVNGALSVITPGYNDTVDELGIDARTRVYDNDGGYNNKTLGLTTANAKALGLIGNGGIDADITFNSDFDFDFNPANGNDAGSYNFLQVAIHEIGHSLGFVSGVDGYDFYGCPSGPGCINDPLYDAQNDWWGSSLDLYRYSANPTEVAANVGDPLAAGPALDWSIRNGATDGLAFAQPYFSIDGGATHLFGNLESRGQINTNSYQASHWRSAAIAGQPYLGIMDAVGLNDQDYYVSALDIAAFNSIGWQTDNDALLDPGYRAYTGAIYAAAVPEPGTWVLMIAGFLAVGVQARRGNRAAVA